MLVEKCDKNYIDVLIENLQDIDEVYFTNKASLDRHYEKHVISDEDGIYKMKYMDKDEYNELANQLSSAKASRLNDRSADIIGYVTKSGRSVKYDKRTNLVVAYVDDDKQGHEAIALYKQPINKFFRKVNGNDVTFAFGSHLDEENNGTK